MVWPLHKHSTLLLMLPCRQVCVPVSPFVLQRLVLSVYLPPWLSPFIYPSHSLLFSFLFGPTLCPHIAPTRLFNQSVYPGLGCFMKFLFSYLVSFICCIFVFLYKIISMLRIHYYFVVVSMIKPFFECILYENNKYIYEYDHLPTFLESFANH